MTTEWELRTAARNLADAYANIHTLKHTPPKPRPARRMRPTFGPRTPSPDGDWSLNLEYSLLHETREEHVPGGLLTMTADALAYTSAAGRYLEQTGGMLCAHLYRNAWEICERFPAVDDLHDLLHAQTAYIHGQINRRYPTPAQPPRVEPRRNSTVICHILGQKGHRLTPDMLRQWARWGHITATSMPGGRNGYLVTEVLDHLTKHAGLDDSPGS